ncbi:MAG TPA: transglycosylase SLT domain-containing protein [Gammaproteobacteria bacterium]|nr:transglycosylase SLT domain-containing protein [Gammaproteobacteria bacterium]
MLLAAVLACSSGTVSAAARPPEGPDPGLVRALRAALANDPPGFRNRYAAEVWLMDMSHRLRPFVPDPKRRLKLLRLIHAEARRADLTPGLVLAVIQVESGFHRFAISSSGAEGLMQVMPFWLNRLHRPHANLFHPETNLRLGCAILHYYLEKAHGDLVEALTLYNGSYARGPAYARKVVHALNHRWYRQ